MPSHRFGRPSRPSCRVATPNAVIVGPIRSVDNTSQEEWRIVVGAQPRSELCAGTIQQGSLRRRGHRAVAVAPWGLAVMVWCLSVCSPRHSGGVKDTGAARVNTWRAQSSTDCPRHQALAQWHSQALWLVRNWLDGMACCANPREQLSLRSCAKTPLPPQRGWRCGLWREGHCKPRWL